MSSNLDLNKFLEGSDYVDNTEKLREAKHSKLIRECINDIEKVRNETGDLYKRNIEEFKGKCNEKNNFLFMNYFTIFNKACNKDFDLNIMNNFLDVLREIEEGLLDQHNGSVKIGKILKELYVDSALKTSERLEENSKNEIKSNSPVKKEINISWKQYKSLKLDNNNV